MCVALSTSRRAMGCSSSKDSVDVDAVTLTSTEAEASASVRHVPRLTADAMISFSQKKPAADAGAAEPAAGPPPTLVAPLSSTKGADADSQRASGGGAKRASDRTSISPRVPQDSGLTSVLAKPILKAVAKQPSSWVSCKPKA